MYRHSPPGPQPASPAPALARARARAFVFSSLLCPLLLFGLLLSCASAPASDDTASEASADASLEEIARGVVQPPFFRIAGNAGATLLMMGTIHLGPAEGWRFSSAVERGVAEADSFILEIDLREATEDLVSTVLAERVVLPTSVLLDDVLSPETAKLLAENEGLLSSLGFPAAARKRFKPWFIAVSVAESATSLSGFAAEQSAESSIVARIGDRPLVGLETFEGQLALFDALPPRLQDVMLRDTVSRLAESAAEFADLVRAWARNDDQALVAIAHQGIDELPELGDFYEILLEQRNRNWVVQLAPLLEDPALAGETVFVAVGALHLVGPGSVVDMLAARGFAVEALHPSRH